ncbi:hypothetical protein [Acidaminobacter sp. JC074]|nr:hypothetical protein [Acidaminobacter sp. JC074]
MKRINYKDPIIKTYKLIKDGKDISRFAVEGLWAYEKLIASNTLVETLI